MSFRLSITDTYYGLSTKCFHELFFEEVHLDKNDLMAEIIANCDPVEFEEARSLIQLFGNKRNIQTGLLDFNKLVQFMFSDKIVHKIEKDLILFQTIYLTKFWILSGNTQIDDAVFFLETALIKFPQNLHFRTELAKIYQRQGKLEEAERVLMDLLDIEKDDLQARTELAKIYQRQGKLEEAERVLMDLLDIEKDDLQARTELAKIYQRQGKLEEAERVLMDLLDIEKDIYRRVRSWRRFISGRASLRKPKEFLRDLLDIDKKNLQARTELAKIYQRQASLRKPKSS